MRRWIELASEGTLGRPVSYEDRQVLFDRGEAAVDRSHDATGAFDVGQGIDKSVERILSLLDRVPHGGRGRSHVRCHKARVHLFPDGPLVTIRPARTPKVGPHVAALPGQQP